MKYKKFAEVALRTGIPEKKLRKGDVATIVEHHPTDQAEDGYTLEVFSALGETITVVTVAEFEIEPLQQNEVFSIRALDPQ